MPLSLTAEITLSFGLIKQGVMLAKQPPIDPGYRGKIVALLHNLSSEPIKIRKKDHILSIVFYELKREIHPKDGYSDRYQNMINLKKFGVNIKGNSLAGLKHDTEQQFENLRDYIDQLQKKQKKSLNRYLSIAITAITVIIAVLTILITFMTGEWIWTNSSEKVHETEDINVNENSIELDQYTISFDGEQINEFTIDGNVITIKFENGDN